MSAGEIIGTVVLILFPLAIASSAYFTIKFFKLKRKYHVDYQGKHRNEPGFIKAGRLTAIEKDGMIAFRKE